MSLSIKKWKPWASATAAPALARFSVCPLHILTAVVRRLSHPGLALGFFGGDEGDGGQLLLSSPVAFVLHPFGDQGVHLLCGFRQLAKLSLSSLPQHVGTPLQCCHKELPRGLQVQGSGVLRFVGLGHLCTGQGCAFKPPPQAI